MYALTPNSCYNVEFTAFLIFSQHGPRSEIAAAFDFNLCSIIKGERFVWGTGWERGK
jgi:hypothetical protein